MLSRVCRKITKLKKVSFSKSFPVGYDLKKNENLINATPIEYTVEKLSNGLTTIIETPEIPTYVTLHLKLKGGLAHENKKTSGYTKWLSNSILQKLSNFPKVEINTQIKFERDGIEILSNLMSNQVEEYLDVFALFFKPDILNNDVLEEMEWDEDENKNIEDLLIKTSFQNYSYGKPLVGLKENYLDKLTFSLNARELHTKTINTSDILITAGGIYNKEEFLDLVNEKFSFITNKNALEGEVPIYKGGKCFLPGFKKDKQFFHSETDMFANQIGVCFPIQGMRYNHEEFMFLNEYVGESSYFISEGPGKGVFLLSADIMRKCYPASEVKSFFNQWENIGLFGFYLKGIENSQEVLFKSLNNLVNTLNKDLEEEKFFRAKNILKRKFNQKMENQFERIPVISKNYIYKNSVGFAGFNEKIDGIKKKEIEILISDILEQDQEKTLVGIGPLKSN
jgi:predicted Zn-dependent peptidase